MRRGPRATAGPPFRNPHPTSPSPVVTSEPRVTFVPPNTTYALMSVGCARLVDAILAGLRNRRPAMALP